MIFSKKLIRKLTSSAILAAISAISIMALVTSFSPPAAAITISPDRVSNVPSNKNGDDLFGKALGAVYIVAGTIAIITIIYGGLLYITSDGDSNKTSTAKNAVLYAVIGLVIVGLAFIITGIIQNIANA